jgi:hypothetical protein
MATEKNSAISRSRNVKILAVFMATTILNQVIYPTLSYALTSGPAQEEFASFEPAGTTDMVDLYSGDFNYNLPLLSVPGPNGGYPINLAYHSGVGMDQEASWVGLGWNINVGAINRQLRGLPDDFKGEQVTQKFKLKPNVTAAFNIPKPYTENFGFPKPQASDGLLNWQVYYNNYKGLGYRVSASLSRDVGRSIVSTGLKLSYDSQNGLGIEPDLSVKGKLGIVTADFKAGTTLTSRNGLQRFSFSSELKAEQSESKMTEKKGYYNYGSSSSLSFATVPSVPWVSIPMKNTTTSFDLNLGTSFRFGRFSTGVIPKINGYVTTSAVDATTTAYNAYGYFNTSQANNGDLKDFQRNTIAYSDKVPNLSPSSFTYDLFMQTGQGTGSLIRPYLPGVNVLSDKDMVSTDIDRRFNLDVGAGANIHIGLGYTQTNGTIRSGSWDGDSALNKDVVKSYSGANAVDYEPYYLQAYGEKSGFYPEADQLSAWGNDAAVRMKITRSDNKFVGSNRFIKMQSDNTGIDANASNWDKKQRQRRANSIENFTANDVYNKLGYTKYTGYQSGSDGSGPYLLDLAKSGIQNSGHLSEISVLQPDGMRYVYGLPAYNNKQVDANFSVASSGDFNTKTVPVPTNVTNTEIDPKGRDGYLSQTELPAYVHSWMLTAVFSSDYFDVTGNGPSDDDYGYWVKFNYEKIATNYKWRVPYQEAAFAEGNRNDPTDDRASFTYGEKEIYYLGSVETKTHIAVFNKTPRPDGLEANSIFAGANAKGTQQSYKLDNIKLYAKKNYIKKIVDPLAAIRKYELNPAATPLKVIKFTYGNSLCTGVNNSTSGTGKLTLTKVEFNSGNSNRGSLSPYVFTYSAVNPVYDNRSIDRWGNYKYTDPAAVSTYPYIDFPYTPQDDSQNPNGWKPGSGEWSLTEIKLPTGGKLKIDYEADDYAYVETKKATHMYDIKGLSLYNAAAVRTAAVVSDFTEKKSANYYKVFFNLEKAIPIASVTSSPYDYVKANYVGDLTKVFFKVFSNLKDGNKDYVSGYADINLDNSGSLGLVTSGSNYVAGYISLLPAKLDKISNADVNPITKAALQHLRADRSELVHTPVPYSIDPLAQVKNLVGSVFNIFDEISQTITGFNSWAFPRGYGQQIDLNGRSVICLLDADGKKYGGGSRVKRIAITDDSWTNKNASNADVLDIPEYGQEYDYTRTDAEGRIISSGVAYEPQIGGEENALHTPVNYSNSTFLANADNLFVQTPILENYYPGASVGYSKVTIRSIAKAKAYAENNANGLKNTAAPLTTYEFYTPKDFPVWFEQTDMNTDPMVNRPIIVPGIYSRFLNRKARSQGYSIVLNDMAGKLKAVAQSTFPPSNNLNGEGTLISKKEYVYNTMEEYSAEKVNRLSSKVQVVSSVNASDTLTYRTATIGQSHDIFIDMNENAQKSKGRGLDANVDIKLPTGLPFMIMPLPYISDFQTSMRTAVTHKVIYRTGILKEITERNYESVVKTEHIAYSIDTGEPLLSKVSNEFKDPVINLTYPASWFYAGMGAASQNIGLQYKPLNAIPFGTETAGADTYVYLPIPLSDLTSFSGNDPSKLIAPGDELYVELGGSTPINTKAVVEATKIAGNILKLYLSIYNGGWQIASTSATFKSLRVVRSGYRNMQSASAGQLASIQKATNVLAYNPLNPSTYKPAATSVNLYDSVLNASALRYTDVLDYVTCRNGLNGLKFPNTVPFWNGFKGRYHTVKEYTYVAPRKNSNASGTDTDNDHIQQGGIVYYPNKPAGKKDFVPFNWKNAPGLYSPAFKPWTLTREVTLFSPWGWETENRDALGNYSAAVYGYDQTVPVAIAKNARNSEVLFDSFENDDIASVGCYSNNDHEHLIGNRNGNMFTNQHHTGERALRVPSLTTFSPGSTTVFYDNAYLQLNDQLRNKFEYLTDAKGNLLPDYIPNNIAYSRFLTLATNKYYYFSCWAKVTPTANDNITLSNAAAAAVSIEFYDNSSVLLETINIQSNYDNASIDGWVKLEGKFKPSNPQTDKLYFKFRNVSNQSTVYYDDVRICPVDANMKAYVYDPVNLQLTAELDENNYATFYNYDSDGKLVRIKKETIQGIQTIKEGRNYVKY